MDRPTEEEQAHIDARNDAIELEREEEQARAEGYCIHCGEDLKNCTGYKCWIRQYPRRVPYLGTHKASNKSSTQTPKVSYGI